MSTLFEDLELTRPTELAFVPRVCEMLLQHHQGEVEAPLRVRCEDCRNRTQPGPVGRTVLPHSVGRRRRPG
ncbi:hypothetical protein C5E41_23820 [Nocardia nova]|nr:hypothetical protein C5E41_23820 [Nocardia nova]